MYKKKLRLFAVIALIICLAVAFFIWRSVDKYVFENSGFYPIGGMKYPVNIGDTAKQNKDEQYSTLKLGEMEEIDGNETCVYVSDRDAIILTSSMCIIPKPSQQGDFLFRLPVFTDVQRNIGNLMITSKTNQYIGDGILLYNGDDTYIVLENATLNIGDKSVNLSPLSYVIACRDQWVQYYDYSRDSFNFEYIELDTPVEITMKNWDLSIDACKDKGSFNGEKFMFFKSVSYLEDFFNYYY